jgi:hypothetical protein
VHLLDEAGQTRRGRVGDLRRAQLPLLGWRCIAGLGWLILGCSLSRILFGLLLDSALAKLLLTGELRECGLLLAA